MTILRPLYSTTSLSNTTQHIFNFLHMQICRTSSNSTELLITLCFYTYFTLQLHCSTPELNHQYHHYHLSTCTSLLITLHSIICTCLPQLLRSASILPRMEPHLDRLHSLPLYPVLALLACYISLFPAIQQHRTEASASTWWQILSQYVT